MGRIVALLVSFGRRLEELTRPVPRELERALERRWAELPEAVRHPAQTLGRRTMGCEGTHGVFPRCNLACTPCYHSRDANRVRVDGAHTLREVDDQMAFLRAERGVGQNAQLIGGEVTLLSPEDHAATLDTMRRHGRKPMSMSHGDVDYPYLRRLAVGPDGRPRARRLRFAAHIDSTMRGRRAVSRPERESDLHEERRRVAQMFARLRSEHGVRSFLAHNMTVTPANVDQIPGVVRAASAMGYRMLSFQPAAYVGNPARWEQGFEALTADAVWRRIEEGVGQALASNVIQHGDERCNRAAYGLLVGARWVAFLDGDDPRDLRARDEVFVTFGAMDFEQPASLVALRMIRALGRRPRAAPVLAAAALRLLRRIGPVSLLRHRPRALTLVMHRFMDARVVAPAWEAMQRGEVASDPDVREAQERLAACSYHMAHPDEGILVPACVQHSVLDPDANRELAERLPVRPAPSIRR